MSDKSSQTVTLRMKLGEEVLGVREIPVALEDAKGTTTTRAVGLLPVTLGSGNECTWVLDDGSVSRRHCELGLSPTGLHIKDLGSKNGIWVHGVRIVEAILQDGDVVTLGSSRLRVMAARGEAELPLSAQSRFGDAVGASPVMRALFAMLERASLSDASILLLGETGTGKELLAEGVHRHSNRRDGPFVVFDCGATAPTLVESELFGYVKGAFTGAENSRKGILEEANGGTLFLDEVGELPPDVQTRLLRALETRTLKPVGGNNYVPFDVRVVAATHRNLKARTESGHFREDLYYRLAVIVASVPPLRERKEDLPLLVELFLSRQNPPLRMDALPPNVVNLLQAHDWPGNVRELLNTVTRLVLFPKLGAKAIEVSRVAGQPFQTGDEYFHLPLREARSALVEAFETAYLRARLRENRGNVTATAKAIGVSRQFLYRLMDQYRFEEKADEGTETS